MVFADTLNPNWWDCSWGGLYFVDDPSWVINTHSGEAAIAANEKPSGGLSLCTSAPFGSNIGDFGLSLFIVGNSDTSVVDVVLTNDAPSRSAAQAARASGNDQSLAISDAQLKKGTTFSKPLSSFVTLSRSYWV